MSLNKECTGCSVCHIVCPVEAIVMKRDAAGFLYPHWSEDKCVYCGKCDEVCPVLFARNSTEEDDSRLFWAQAKDDGILERSSSGGVFFGMASACLEGGGIVVGAAFSEGCIDVVHKAVRSVEELPALMRSKYVQSYIPKEAFDEIVTQLREERSVFFSGTPCQVAAVKGLLKVMNIDDAPFIAMDFVCHGVPSPKLWTLWLARKSAGRKCNDVVFRDKRTGWKNYSICYCLEGEELVSARRDDWYMRSFLFNYSLRPACFSCPFKKSYLSDCTLADYWGFSSPALENADELGVSGIIVRTEKGSTVFDRIKGSYRTGEGDMASFCRANPASRSSSSKPSDYEGFMALLGEIDRVDPLMDRWPQRRGLRYFVNAALSACQRLIK